MYKYTQGVDVPKDPSSNALPMVTLEHTEIHAERYYSVAVGFTVDDTDTGAIQLTVPDETKATKTITSTGTKSDVTLTAKRPGSYGNDISVEFIAPAGADEDLEVVVTNRKITVNLATDALSAIESTAAEVKAAIDAHAEAKLLVDVSVQDDGSDEVEAESEVSLEDGVDKLEIHLKVASVAVDDGEMEAKLEENATITGSANTPVNRNRLSDKTSQLAVISGNDVNVAGATKVTLDSYLFGTIGQANLLGEELILKRDETYVLSVENSVGTNEDVNLRLEWYERVIRAYTF